MIPIKNVKYVIIDDGLFWSEDDVLLIPNKESEQRGIVYYSEKEKQEKPVHAIAFSAYDGFAIKDIFWIYLKIPSILISSENRFPELIKKRCNSLQIQDYVPGISDKCSWINEFGKQHNINEIMYFGNNQEVISKFPFAAVVTTKLESDPKRNIFAFRPPFAIRQFVNKLAEQEIEIKDHLSNKFGALINFSSQNESEVKSEVESEVKNVLVLDIDGTITDPRMIVAEDGCSWKRMSVEDLHAIRDWNRMGNVTYLLTGDSSTLPFKLAKITETPVDNTIIKAGNKKAQLLQEICRKNNYLAQNVTYAGDDIVDRAVMEWLHSKGGKIACPDNSMPQIKEISGIHKLKNYGGYGAIKELIDSISRE